MQTITVEVEISDDGYYCYDCQFCTTNKDGLPYCLIFGKLLNQYYDLNIQYIVQENAEK